MDAVKLNIKYSCDFKNHGCIFICDEIEKGQIVQKIIQNLYIIHKNIMTTLWKNVKNLTLDSGGAII